jgi:prolyl 4-hydroxylase
MRKECAPSCQFCDQLPFDTRCPFDYDAPVAWQEPGRLNNFFEHISANPDYEQQYGPLTILSSPNLNDGPWIVLFDNFLSPEECDRLIEFGVTEGYERSSETGETNDDGSVGDDYSDRRTSTTAWCTPECPQDPLIGSVLDRLDNLTALPYENSEFLQLLRYNPGEKYSEHHDFLQHEVERPQGPRILTIFLYLNDVEKGGGTRFTALNMTVMPKRGRVVVWPSVLDGHPMVMDPQTFHEALPVDAGIKYGANSWIHQRDFKTPWSKDCV